MRHSATSPRIVLLDDDPFMLRLLTRMLAFLEQRNVICFTDGAQALELCRTPGEPVDLIVLDINMPGMDGVEFIRRLVGYGYEGSILLVSGEDTRILESVEKLLQLHQLTSLGHLPKPVKSEELRPILKRLRPRTESFTASRGDTAPRFSGEELRRAILGFELVNYYQPQVSLTTGELVGAESLVRWRHSRHGLVMPDRFIGLAVEHGLMTELTQAVLSAAIHQLQEWRRLGWRIPIAVNVSMDDLTRLDFPDLAAACAAAAGVEPSLITLEVTEGQVMRQLSTALDVISRLRLKRFRLAIDDFGTGHSSLAQLRDLPFDELKIDRGFVHGAAHDVTLRAICSASLRMAQQLQMHVVAEGIEDAADWHLLRQLGCDAAQGYLIARPMTAAELTGWAADWPVRHRNMVTIG